MNAIGGVSEVYTVGRRTVLKIISVAIALMDLLK